MLALKLLLAFGAVAAFVTAFLLLTPTDQPVTPHPPTSVVTGPTFAEQLQQCNADPSAAGCTSVLAEARAMIDISNATNPNR